jgi:hypothetical protein
LPSKARKADASLRDCGNEAGGGLPARKPKAHRRRRGRSRVCGPELSRTAGKMQILLSARCRARDTLRWR